MWLKWWDCWAPVIYHCLCACITVSQHWHNFDWNARSSFLRCVARENACGCILLVNAVIQGGNCAKEIYSCSFPQKVYEISQSFTSSSGNRKQTRDTDSCLERRDGIFFNYVLRWHCKPLALVCSHHGLAITDSHYSQRIPLLFLGLQPLHPIHSEFISNCLCDIEQCTIASRCSELKSQYIMKNCALLGLLLACPQTRLLNFLFARFSSQSCIHPCLYALVLSCYLLATSCCLFPDFFHWIFDQ